VDRLAVDSVAVDSRVVDRLAVDSLAVDGGDEIGCGGVRRLVVPGSPEGRSRFEIKHLFIRPGAQGRGLGRALLSELENRAIAFGATEIVLDTNASLVAAGGLYRSTGYRNVEPYNDNPNATDWYLKQIP
jgi:ribosomal protein S18 acetylase RimI-like enzyme